MSNANFEPMPFRRAFGKGGAIEPAGSSLGRSLADLEAKSTPPIYDDNAFVDSAGQAIMKPIVSGACRKCGLVGHLTFQCRNFLQIHPNVKTTLDISSTSSDSETETPLVKKSKKIKKKKEKKRSSKKEKKKSSKKKKSYSSSDSDDDDSKKKRKRKRSSSTSSNDSDSDDHRRRKIKKEEKKKKKKKSKKSHHSDSD